MKRPVINWVVAMKPEAQPLIQRLDMKPAMELSRRGFTVFQNQEANHRLIISGIGKVNSAAATAWLGQFSEPWDAWLNFGVGGNRTAEIGTIFRAGRIMDFATERSWYPTAVWPRKEDHFLITEVITVNKPTANYPDPRSTVEMEAAGFFPTALRFSSTELIQAIKVISDNESTDISELNGQKIQAIVEKAVEDVVQWLSCLESVSQEEKQRLANPEGWESLVKNYRFTETEQHQLKRLCSRALTLGKLDSVEEWSTQSDFTTGKQILRALNQLLSDAKSAED